MQSFDIDSLLRFTPPHALCERCCAFLTNIPDALPFRCPVCGVMYLPTDEHPSLSRYLEARGLSMAFDDSVAHAQTLALLGRRARAALNGQTTDYPPMRALLEALNTAQRCVHFTTFGISAFLLGALKLAAQRVPVRGIISGIKRDEIYRDLTTHAGDAPLMQTRLFGQDSQWFPHQKIVIIDGMFAFKGSANMTDIGWRKAAQGREHVEIITDVREVTELNNRFFSPVWVGFDRAEQPTEPVAPTTPSYGGV